MKNVEIKSVLNPAGPKSADDRVAMLAETQYGEPLPQLGHWTDLTEARREADRYNAMSETEFANHLIDLANE